MKVFRDFMRFYIIPVVLLIGLVLTAGFTAYYTFTTKTQAEEIIGSNTPRDFTLAFSKYISCADGLPAITDTGKAQLDDNGLWLQILNASGAEVLSYRSPAGTPSSYSPYKFLELYQYGTGDYSVFVSSAEVNGVLYSYLIGFPLSISKVVMYVDTARYQSGKLLIIATIVLTTVLVVTLTLYSYKTFYSAEKQQRLDEKAKEEWLVNITHDLKTPLAPIRGYAELLSEEEILPAARTQQYGKIILKNALYTQQLVDDLKLTYQLQSNMLPLKKNPQNITRFVKEVVIDILNTPEYEGRDISFYSDCDELRCDFDAQLFRRALTNIIINALKHNTPDTKIAVSIKCDHGITLSVSDNGCGMTAQELNGLFIRYYRGTSTEVKAEGSGLGMAIAKQIVEAHGGKLYPQSKIALGTTIVIELPQKFKV